MSNDKLYGPFEGTVTKRDDPSKLGKIKINIPGLFEPETPMWVQPICVPGGGNAQRGHYEPPSVGSNVGIHFIQGDRRQPRYYIGPWGAPSGISDVPTGGEVEGDNRQNAVTEDEEWTIQRDSRTTGKKYLIKHKSSDQSILINADTDEIHIVREDSDQAFLRGTEYRTAEATAMSDLASALTTAGSQLNAAGTDTAFDTAFHTAALALVAAGAALTTGATNLNSHDIASDPTAYLSEKLFSE
jgi:hypothetical protein